MLMIAELIILQFAVLDSMPSADYFWALQFLTNAFQLLCDHQYFKHFHLRHIHFFELFPILFGVVIVWVYATILTVAGAYDHASALGQMHCRTDRSGLVSHAPW